MVQLLSLNSRKFPDFNVVAWLSHYWSWWRWGRGGRRRREVLLLGRGRRLVDLLRWGRKVALNLL